MFTSSTPVYCQRYIIQININFKGHLARQPRSGGSRLGPGVQAPRSCPGPQIFKPLLPPKWWGASPPKHIFLEPPLQPPFDQNQLRHRPTRLFSGINISQGSVATRLKCGGILIANSLYSVLVYRIFKNRSLNDEYIITYELEPCG